MSEEEGKEARTWYTLITVGVLVAFVIVSYLLLQYTNSKMAEYSSAAQEILDEYNAQLIAYDCEPSNLGYICSADATVKLPDSNTGVKIFATAQVLIEQDGNTLNIVKLSPATESQILQKVEIPSDVREVLQKITFVVSDYMYCESAKDTEYVCYIPTNMAPLGNAVLYYAPLFRIQLDNGEVSVIKVYV